MTPYAAIVQAHYAGVWSDPTDCVRPTRGRIGELPEDFGILVIPRSADTQAYATRCMSQPGDLDRLELHVVCSAVSAVGPDLVELLSAVAHYHRTEQLLGLGHSVNFGRPVTARSSCSYGLVSLPYLDGPKLEWHESPDIRFLWLIPITEAEVEYKKRYGLEALELRLEASRFDYRDPFRASVV